jgi:hypothetical protein
MPRKKKTTEEKTTKKTEVKKTKAISVGDTVVLVKDHKSFAYFFPAGSKVLVVKEGPRGFSINNNPENPKKGLTMEDCGFEL